MKTSDLLQRRAGWPFLNSLDLAFIHMDALGRNNIPLKDDLGVRRSDTSQDSHIAPLEPECLKLNGVD